MLNSATQDNLFVNLYKRLFGGKYKQIDGEHFSVSFMSALNLPDVHLLLWSGSFIICANHLALLIQKEEIAISEKDHNWYFWYFIGSCAAYAVAGIYHDLFSYGKLFFTLAVLNAISVVI